MKSSALNFGELWCQKHARSYRIKPKILQRAVTSEMINLVLEEINQPLTKDQMIESVTRRAPLCCHLGDDKMFSLMMVTSARIRGLTQRWHYYALQSAWQRRLQKGER